MELDEKLSAMQRSEGLLRIKDASLDRRRSAGSMSHYASSAEERKTRREPRAVRRFENSYGGAEIGIDRRGRLSVLISAQRQHNKPGLRAAARGFSGAHAKWGSAGGSYFQYNPPEEKHSALLFREDSQHSNAYIYHNLLRIFHRMPRDVMQDVLPFYQPDIVEKDPQFEQQQRRFLCFFMQSLDMARKQSRPANRDSPSSGEMEQQEDNIKQNKQDERRNQFF